MHSTPKSKMIRSYMERFEIKIVCLIIFMDRWSSSIFYWVILICAKCIWWTAPGKVPDTQCGALLVHRRHMFRNGVTISTAYPYISQQARSFPRYAVFRAAYRRISARQTTSN
jgi:hypothetical protein